MFTYVRHVNKRDAKYAYSCWTSSTALWAWVRGVVKRRGLNCGLELVLQASRDHMTLLFKFHPEDSSGTRTEGRKQKEAAVEIRVIGLAVWEMHNKNTFLAVCTVCLHCYNVCLNFKPQLFRLDAITVPYSRCTCKELQIVSKGEIEKWELQ